MTDLSLFPDIVFDDGETKREFKNCLTPILVELMEQSGVSQAEVSRKTGIPTTTISDWCNGRVYTQSADGALKALADFFNVTVDYLLFGIGEDPEEASDKMLEVFDERRFNFSRKLCLKFSKQMNEQDYETAKKLGFLSDAA